MGWYLIQNICRGSFIISLFHFARWMDNVIHLTCYYRQIGCETLIGLSFNYHFYHNMGGINLAWPS